MERDFLGLSSKESVPVVKEEIADDGCKDSGLMKGSEAQWAFTNKVSALPNLSFRAAQEDKVFSASNQPSSVSLVNHFTKNHFASMYPNAAMQHLFGGIPAASSNSGFVGGTTDPWKGSNASGSPAQLTIFYAGTVCVYDDISPEKAQAIMFLAGKGTSTNPKPQIEGAGESFAVKPPVAAPQSGSGPSCTVELTASKPTGISALPITKVDPSKPGNVIRPICAATMMTSAIPQAPKASLARFLAKRRERAMNACTIQHQ